MKNKFRVGAVVFLVLGVAGCGAGGLDQILRTLDRPLDEETVVAGLKEALHVGTDRAVGTTSAVDGFLGNAALRILIPPELEDVASTLRRIGLGGEVDAFEIAMNRAAERASGEARGVFWDAVRSMTIADGFSILRGHETAATEYFRGRTAAELEGRFLPIVRDKMSETGLYSIYNTLLDAYRRVPLVSEPEFDLDRYITDRTVDGLFRTLGEEEVRIRRDPAARTTELLRRVFAETASR